MEENESIKKLDNVLEKVAKSHTLLKNEDLVSILAGIVKDDESNENEIKKIADTFDKAKLSTEDIVRKTIMITVNCVVTSVYNSFKAEIDKAYEANQKLEKKSVVN